MTEGKRESSLTNGLRLVFFLSTNEGSIKTSDSGGLPQSAVSSNFIGS